MPKLSYEKQIERREHILNAAERCFTKTGFRTATMHDICDGAGISSGALYTYFSSKEGLIIGLCERERDRFRNDLARLSGADDFFAALRAMAEHYTCDEPMDKVRLHVEIGAEATRNEVIQRTVHETDLSIRQAFAELLDRQRKLGKIELKFPVEVVIRAMAAIGDGLFWHRAVSPDFDPKPIIPAMMAMVSALIAPVQPAEQPFS